eukprot:1159414-Pelagomonas_calceolata.AAC.2
MKGDPRPLSCLCLDPEIVCEGCGPFSAQLLAFENEILERTAALNPSPFSEGVYSRAHMEYKYCPKKVHKPAL